MSWKEGEVEGNGSKLWELTEGYVAITAASSLSASLWSFPLYPEAQ